MVSPDRQTVVVSPSGEGNTGVSVKLKSSRPNTRIIVHPGLYREVLIIDKHVEIIGEGPIDQIIVESSEGSCILMQNRLCSGAWFDVALPDKADE